MTALVAVACAQTAAGSRPTPSPTVASPSPSAPPIGDACLVGRWIDQRSVNETGWTYNGEVVPVAGLAGYVITFDADGNETADWSNSEPLIGTYRGQQLKIVLRGLYTFNGVKADGANIVLPSGSGTFSAQFFLGGQRESTYSAHAGGDETDAYTCGATSLQESTLVGTHMNTDSYLRG